MSALWLAEAILEPTPRDPRGSCGGHRRCTNSAHGFTLVELLVVIGVIAVLIALLLPSLARAREAARSIKCASNIRQVYMAMQMYSVENEGRLPIPAWLVNSPDPSLGINMKTGGVAGIIDYQVGALLPYLGPSAPAQFDLFNCPTDLDEYRITRLGSPSVVARNFSYSFNWQMRNAPNKPDGSGIRFTDIVQPSQKILIAEEEFPNDPCAYITFAGDQNDQLTARHNHRGNQGFGDGHVESIKPEDLGFSPTGGAPTINIDQTRSYCDLYY